MALFLLNLMLRQRQRSKGENLQEQTWQLLYEVALGKSF